MTFRQAICLSRSSNRGDGVQAGEDLVTLHCFAWPRIAADDVQTGRCSSCAILRGVQMARVVREDWPHVDMDMGKRQVGEGKWAGEEGARAHTLQGLIRRASRLSPVPRLRTPPRVSAGCITFTMSRELLFVFFAVRSAVSALDCVCEPFGWCASSPSGEPCAAVQARFPSFFLRSSSARGPGECHCQRVAVGSSILIIAHPHDRRIPTMLQLEDAGP